MIEAITPLILHTVAQAGGPVTLRGLLDRLRTTLSDRALLTHVQDLISAQQLQATDSAHSGIATLLIHLPEGAVLPEALPTFGRSFDDPKPVLKKPPKPPADPLRKAMAEANRRAGKRARMAPTRERVLHAVDQSPASSAELAATLGMTRMSIQDHIHAMRRAGLVVRYATTRSARGVPIPLWVSARLRPSLPGPPPVPPRPALVRRQKARIEHRSNTAHTEERA